ncbi:hypothetical protein [Desulfatitalea alkaliphila]|uniref:Uncharacterized protein n=1 Tax=Desulfatitalea alkaliphila TaxID=2929485 RepID=A0AA41UK05_9BACT|nr:hypothetical protein [Desulfatitalea alkaliphila]MCJ8502530.1 hypothetical protein [Desulfatitalea alkaliphila]
MTTFKIEHQCPQCGAPAELTETDRLVQCGFCRVKSYLHAPAGVFRYLLPDRAPAGTELIYVPYWRFKGMCFSCYPGGMDKRFADVTRQAIATHHFPVHLGFRSQTQKLRFAVGRPEGVFLKPRLSKTDLVAELNQRFRANLRKPVLHQAQIGETLSLLYAPFYLKERLMDAVLNEPVPTGSAEGVAPFLDDHEPPKWPIDFIATLCPQCGWDLHGTSDALALTCDNCQTVWWARKGRLERLPTHFVAGETQDNVYMPFWRIQADVTGVALKSYADLIRVANLPKVAQPGMDTQPFYFWTPAFKVRPHRFLSFGAHVTAAQPAAEQTAGYPPRSATVHGVNLSIQEAVESLKLLLAVFVRPRKRLEEVLQTMQIKARRYRLVYLPFEEGHHEWIHRDMLLAINKNLLSHARRM